MLHFEAMRRHKSTGVIFQKAFGSVNTAKRRKSLADRVFEATEKAAPLPWAGSKL